MWNNYHLCNAHIKHKRRLALIAQRIFVTAFLFLNYENMFTIIFSIIENMTNSLGTNIL